jgi:predicted transcriptional regulator
LDGIIIEQPFGKMIINGEKRFDFRKNKPTDKIGKTIFLITEDKVIGEIMIVKCRYNQLKRSYYWEFAVVKKYSTPKKFRAYSVQGEWVMKVKIG